MQCQIPDSSDDMFHKITETFGLEDVEHLQYHQKVEGEERAPKKLTEEQREENIHKVFTRILNS